MREQAGAKPTQDELKRAVAWLLLSDQGGLDVHETKCLDGGAIAVTGHWKCCRGGFIVQVGEWREDMA